MHSDQIDTRFICTPIYHHIHIYSQMPHHHVRTIRTIMATASATGEARLGTTNPAADEDGEADEAEEAEELEELQSEPEAAAGMVATVVAADAALVDVTTTPSSASVLEAAQDAEPRPATLLSATGELHLPSSPVSSEALVMAAGLVPQLVYCCMWTALVSRSMTTGE